MHISVNDSPRNIKILFNNALLMMLTMVLDIYSTELSLRQVSISRMTASVIKDLH